MSDNLKLWQTVEKTDPKHVKPITGKSYQGNSPKPHYLVHKATETFGPAGIGWGFTVVDERIEEGAPGERMSIARVRVWYKWNGERGEVEHVGGTQFSGTRKSGQAFTDEDAPKKSVTDALIKALSLIGFAGDIFMGRYDDSKYVEELREEARAASQSPQAEGRSQVKTPLNSEIEPDPDTREAMTYVKTALDIIRVHKGSESELRSWWSDEAGKRREYRLSQAQVDILLGKLKERVEALTQKEPA